MTGHTVPSLWLDDTWESWIWGCLYEAFQSSLHLSAASSRFQPISPCLTLHNVISTLGMLLLQGLWQYLDCWSVHGPQITSNGFSSFPQGETAVYLSTPYLDGDGWQPSVVTVWQLVGQRVAGQQYMTVQGFHFRPCLCTP